MYRCEVCRATSPPRTALLRHTLRGNLVQQRNGLVTDEISREVRVCRRCLSDLEAGANLASLVRERRAEEALPAPVVVAPPEPVQPPVPLPVGVPLLTLAGAVIYKPKRERRVS